ncbi:MAG: FAD-binding oxidoreductase, partial [Actinobacteria bacterium]|nr:FAD-binding oxidoreductase [Actinomycetota bacterium]
MVTQNVSSWGRVTSVPHEVVALTGRASAARTIAQSRGPGLAYGNGRSYGDVCLNEDGVLWLTRGLDRFIDFDAASGLLECEAGVTLKEIIDLALPQGWFLSVTPGTQYVTVGGAIANDVHGKNHHSHGCFGEHVEQLTLLRTDGSRIVCGPDRQADWFRATVAGLGLTGVISSARLRLRKVEGAWLSVESTVFESLDEFFDLSATASASHEYTVSWIDCSTMQAARTRGIFLSGRHSMAHDAEPSARVRRMPFTPPLSLINRASLPTINGLYFHGSRLRRDKTTQHYTSFFYPLDGFLEWNR